MAQLVKNPTAMQEAWVLSLGREDPLEKGKATHSSILAWRIIVHGVAKSWTRLRNFQRKTGCESYGYLGEEYSRKRELSAQMPGDKDML